MSKRWLFLIVPLLVALPSILYSMVMVEIVDEVVLQTKSVGGVLFSHNTHGGKFRCDACHPKLFEKKRSATPVSMQAMERGKSCGACHNGRQAFTVTENCVACHAGDIVYEDKDAGDVTFSHANHTGLFGCGECHPDLFKAERGVNRATMEEMEKGASCGACHDGSGAFSVAEECQACHNM